MHLTYDSHSIHSDSAAVVPEILNLQGSEEQDVVVVLAAIDPELTTV